MLNIQTILAPIDFSERSTATLEHAAALADRFGARILAAHFIAPAPYEYAAFDEGFYAAAALPDAAETRDKIDVRMAKLLAEALPNREVERLVAKDDVVIGIERIVKERAVDMIVMPTHGYGPFRRMLLGSVTSKVLHDLEIPVFTGAHVPEVTPWDREPYKRIACAIGLDEHSEHTLRWAWDFAQLCEKDLIVIHAAPRFEAGGVYGDWYPADAREALLANARKHVDELLAKVGCAGAEVHVDSADTVPYIAEQTEKSYADILVVGRTKQGGVLTGLRTEAFPIIRESPAPVISV